MNDERTGGRRRTGVLVAAAVGAVVGAAVVLRGGARDGEPGGGSTGAATVVLQPSAVAASSGARPPAAVAPVAIAPASAPPERRDAGGRAVVPSPVVRGDTPVASGPTGASPFASSPGGASAPSAVATPAARPGDPTVPAGDGGAPPPTFPPTADGLREAMAYHRYDLRDCYEPWTHQHPGFGGRVVAEFDVAEREGVVEVTNVVLAESSLRHTPLEGCIVSVLRTMRFTAPEGGALHVRYPVVLSSDRTSVAPSEAAAADAGAARPDHEPGAAPAATPLAPPVR